MGDTNGGSFETRPMGAMLVALTAVSGVVDAVAFLGLGGVFTAFLTGNLLFLGFAAAHDVGTLSPAAPLTVLVFFILGASIGARLWAAIGRNLRRWLPAAAALSAALLAAAALAGIGLSPVTGSPGLRHYVLMALTAAAMGVRAATIRRLGASLNTILVTFTLVSWILDSPLGRGSGSPDQVYRLLAVLAVCAGGAAGALLLRSGLTVPLLVAAAGTIGAVGAYLVHPASRPPEG